MSTFPAACPVSQAAPVLAEALERFEKEARHGTCDTGRYRCPYAVWGEGPPLLCIPGLSDDARSFVMLLAILSGHFRCITYDLPTGRSDGARLSRYTHDDLVQDVFALLDCVEARQSYVVGCSFGSTIALGALLAKPERLPRAVLQGGFARRPLAPAEVLLARLARYWRRPVGKLPLRRALLRRVHHGPFVSRPPEVWDFLVERWGSAPTAAVAHRALLLHRLDLRPQLPAIRQPVLLVCGDSDPLVHRQAEEELLAGLANAARIVLPSCGHNPLFTCPETLAEIIGGFLTPPVCPAQGDNSCAGHDPAI